MAEAQTSTLGGGDLRPIASHRTRVSFTRLSRIKALRPGVHLAPAMFAPAKWTTASGSSRPVESTVPRSGSQPQLSPWVGVGDCDRTKRITRWPLAVRKGTSADPMSPLEPVTRIRIGRRPLCNGGDVLSGDAVTIAEQPLEFRAGEHRLTACPGPVHE